MTLSRDVPVVPHQTALLLIDVQNYNTSWDGGEFKHIPPGERASYDYFFDRLNGVTLPNIKRLQDACRASSIEVMYTVIEALTRDMRDLSLDYKISGLGVPRGHWDAKVPDSVAAGEDEIILPKTSSSVFISTNIDYVLRSLGVKQLVMVGLLTDQCVESAVRDACDLGYLVTLVPDACATYSAERQDASVRAISGYCRQRSTDELLAELAVV